MSKSRDSGLDFPDRSEIWQAARQSRDSGLDFSDRSEIWQAIRQHYIQSDTIIRTPNLAASRLREICQ